MKKLSERHRRWLMHNARARQRNSIHRMRLRHRRALGLGAVPEVKYLTPKPEFSRGRFEIALPEDCSFSRCHDQLLEVIDQLREYGVRNRSKGGVRFDHIHQIGDAAALVIAAEIDRWTRIRHFRPMIHLFRDWDPDVARQLHEMGLFDLLDPTNPPNFEKATELSKRFIRFRSSNLAKGQLAKDVRLAIEQVSGTELQADKLFTALTEAISNTLDHAYPDEATYSIPVLRRTWWMAGSYTPPRRELTVMFYDQGVGIPRTIPKRYGEILPDVLRRLGGTGDAHLIEAAMELGRSGTGQKHRGRGMDKMRHFVNQSPTGRLRILSGRGEYIYNSTGQAERHDYKRSLGGTLIEWTITI